HITTPFPLKLEHPPWHVYQEQDWPDCFATLGFLAACTTRVRLGTSVIILPYRHPAVVAKQVATLDRLSGGRSILGVGIGWLPGEFECLGVRFAERAAMSEEYIAVMKALWAGEQPRGAGRYVTIDQAVNFGPLPLQQPHPPLWVGGNSLPALRRAARWGDGWQPVYLPPPVIAQKLGQLRALTEEAGRGVRPGEGTEPGGGWGGDGGGGSCLPGRRGPGALSAHDLRPAAGTHGADATVRGHTSSDSMSGGTKEERATFIETTAILAHTCKSTVD